VGRALAPEQEVDAHAARLGDDVQVGEGLPEPYVTELGWYLLEKR
jgi:hypothetical protein